MKPSLYNIMVVAAVCLAAAESARAATLKCPPDSVKVGNACIDLYEESVWQIAPTNKSLLKKVQSGKASLDDLTSGGAVQLGCTGAPFNLTDYPTNFPASGQWTPVLGSSPPTPGVYAVSIPGVLPSTCTTWFQAVQACAVSGKRLARNEEWQRAAAGTPDPGTDDGSTDCNISTAGSPVNTGSRSKCKSSWGVFDMVGNASEWVADGPTWHRAAPIGRARPGSRAATSVVSAVLETAAGAPSAAFRACCFAAATGTTARAPGSSRWIPSTTRRARAASSASGVPAESSRRS